MIWERVTSFEQLTKHRKTVTAIVFAAGMFALIQAPIMIQSDDYSWSTMTANLTWEFLIPIALGVIMAFGVPENITDPDKKDTPEEVEKRKQTYLKGYTYCTWLCLVAIAVWIFVILL